jgi:hypothetical protein
MEDGFRDEEIRVYLRWDVGGVLIESRNNFESKGAAHSISPVNSSKRN